MESDEFYNYLLEKFNLDGTSGRLVKNILDYVECQGFVGAEDARAHLRMLLDGAFGLEYYEVEMYHRDFDSKMLFVIGDEIFDNANSAARHIQDQANKKIVLWQLTEDLEVLTGQLHEDQDELWAEVHDVDVKILRNKWS